MKKAALILSIIFIILTFVGAGYVLYNGGKINAGYAIIPMVFALFVSLFTEIESDYFMFICKS